MAEWSTTFVALTDDETAIDAPVTGEVIPGAPAAATSEFPKLRMQDQWLKDGLERIAALFHATTGHAHTGSGTDGKPIAVGTYAEDDCIGAAHRVGTYAGNKVGDRQIQAGHIQDYGAHPGGGIDADAVTVPEHYPAGGSLRVEMGANTTVVFDGGGSRPELHRVPPFCLAISSHYGTTPLAWKSYLDGSQHWVLELHHGTPPPAGFPDLAVPGALVVVYWR